jgi:ABC-type dipeptide/oligopeptide/nickel transport system permease subunit
MAFGASKPHIMFKQIFPNVTTNLIILASQNFGGCLLIEASLSFLNLGVQAPDPSWGNMINVGRNYLVTQPWLAIAPGIALMLIVLALNFLGDGLRDVLDPKENRGRLGRNWGRKRQWVK